MLRARSGNRFQWVWERNWIQYTAVSVISVDKMAAEPTPPFRVKAIADYNAASGSELSLVTGTEYDVTATDGRGVWWQSYVNGVVGWFPASYTQIIPAAAPTPAPAPVPAPITQAQPAASSSMFILVPVHPTEPLRAAGIAALASFSSRFSFCFFCLRSSCYCNFSRSGLTFLYSIFSPRLLSHRVYLVSSTFSGGASSAASAAHVRQTSASVSNVPAGSSSPSLSQRPAATTTPIGGGAKKGTEAKEPRPAAPVKQHIEKNKKNLPTYLKLQSTLAAPPRFSAPLDRSWCIFVLSSLFGICTEMPSGIISARCPNSLLIFFKFVLVVVTLTLLLSSCALCGSLRDLCFFCSRHPGFRATCVPPLK